MFSYSFPSRLTSSQLEAFEMRSVELSWKKLFIVGRLEVIGKLWPWVVMVVLAPLEIQVIFPARILCLIVGIIVGPWVGHIHMSGQYLLCKENMTLFKHMVHGLTVVQARVVINFGLTWVTRPDSFVSRASNLLIRLKLLASAAMNDSIEWRSPFEEKGFVVLDFSEVYSHWMIFWARSLHSSHPRFSSFYKNLLGTWFLESLSLVI